MYLSERLELGDPHVSASSVIRSSAASWDLILGYGRRRRGLKWATLLLVTLFLITPLTCGVRQYRRAAGLFDSSEQHLRSYETVLQRASSSPINPQRLAQHYPEISASGLLDDRMRVSRMALPARAPGAADDEGMDASAVLGPNAVKSAMAARDRGRAVMSPGSGPFGLVVVMPVYRNSHPPRSLSERRGGITGWSFVAFRPDALIHRLASDTKHVELEIFDGATLIAATTEKRTVTDGSAIGLRFQRNVDVFGRTWLVRQQQRTFLAEMFRSPLSLLAMAALLMATLAWILYAIRRRSFELGRRMLDVLVDVITVVDANGRIAYASASLTKTFGFAPEEVIGQRFLGYIHPDDEAAVLDAIEALKEREDAEVEIRRRQVRDKDGHWHYVEATARTIGRRGKRMGIFIVMHDVTDVLLLEEQVERSSRVESLGRVAAQVAHEFNNVLMTIQTTLAVLERRHAVDTSMRGSLSQMLRSVARGQAIAKEILRFGQPVEISHKPIDIEAGLRNLEEELRPLLPETVTLEVDIAERVTVVGDANQLSQVIVNLVINARDAIRSEGRVVCAVERSEGGRFPFGMVPSGEFAHLEVRDNGVGMPPSVSGHVFEPLFTTKKHGTGLGLAICHRIVTAHHGMIFAESDEGKGTDVHIFLPTETKSLLPPQRAGAAPPEASGRPPESAERREA
jgi:PAS domain S-box-containing protein